MDLTKITTADIDACENFTYMLEGISARKADRWEIGDVSTYTINGDMIAMAIDLFDPIALHESATSFLWNVA